MKAPQQVIAMLQDCHNEAEAAGFEVDVQRKCELVSITLFLFFTYDGEKP